jgi:hypothetical protein
MHGEYIEQRNGGYYVAGTAHFVGFGGVFVQ